MGIRSHKSYAVMVLAILAAAWLVTAPPISAQIPDDFDGFRVEGRHLYDRFGTRTVLVGINKMVIWRDRDGLPAFPEIAKTGANAVRVVWLTEGSAEELDSALSNAISNKLIPIVDCHDTTGKWELLSTCVDYWVRPDVMAVLRRHESYLLLNIANEAGASVVAPQEFRSAYELAIRRIRAAGLHVPLVIDAQGWGQSIDDLQLNGPYLITADPDHNLMFSIHMWWPSAQRGAGITQLVVDEIAQSVEMDLPLLIGEFANKGPGCSCCIPYRTIIEQAHDNEIGYLPWSWGPGNSDCDEMDMTEDGTFDTLHAWGLEVAITSPHSIQAIAIRPDWIVSGTPVPPPTPAPTPTALPAPEGLLSVGAPVTVSSIEREELAGASAVDGRLTTRWSSAYTDPQGLVVDLGESRDIGRIVLEWETAFGREYKLQASDDATEWRDLVHVTDGDGGRDDHAVSASARYVRMLGLKRSTEWGYSLWEFWVFDRADRPLPEPDQVSQVSDAVDPRPDLVVTEITWSPDPILEGSPVTFRAEVTNHGNSTAYRDQPVRCIFQIGTATIAQGALDRPLPPGESTVVEVEVAPGALAARHPDLGETFIVLAWVDPGIDDLVGVVAEIDETNNLATAYGYVADEEKTDSIARPEASATTLTPSDKATPEPLPTVAPAAEEPGVLIPAPASGAGRLIAAAALVVVGAALVAAIGLKRRRNS